MIWVFRLIDDEQVVAGRDSGSFGWTRYYELDEINAWLDGIFAAYPDVTEEFIVGESYEKRTIRGIKISHGTNKPGIFIESNIHAREWITSATATWFINELLSSEKAEVRNLAESYDWYIVPVFNVDGFVYSHTSVSTESSQQWNIYFIQIFVTLLESHVAQDASTTSDFDLHWC